MTASKTLIRSFAGGVITPEMHGRLDQVKHQTGLSEAINFRTLPHGPAENRAGFGYVVESGIGATRVCLIPFIYSTTQSMVLEFGHQYVRFHTLGGTLLEAEKTIVSITQAQPGVLEVTGHGYTAGQSVFVSDCLGMTSLNGRVYKVIVVDSNHIYLTDLDGAQIDTNTLPAYTASSGAVARVYQIVSPYSAADLFDLHYTQSADVLTLTHPAYHQRELRRLAATNWQFTALSFTPTIAAPASVTVAAPVASGADTTYTYVATAIAAGTLEESYASPPDDVSNKLTTSGNYNTITPAAVTGAVRYNIYRLLNGLYGFIGQSDGTALIDNNITPDTTRTPPLADPVMGSAGNYPGAVGYFQGRRWFAGTTNDPQRVLATRSGTEGNMTYSIPARDSDRLSFRIAARQANTIRHIVPVEDLVLLTSGGPWVVASAGGPITGATLDARPKGSIGASNVQPLITEGAVLYATDRGNRIREFAYRGDINGGYQGRDASIMAPHYFDRFDTVQMAFTRAPHPTAWFVRSDGALLGLTYVPEHDVAAWHMHTTQGLFESVCSVPEGDEDVLYAVVQREIGNRTVRYIERMHTRLYATQADAFFLDSAVRYEGAPATTISGLHHLEGMTVNALADGAVVRDLVVQNGSITLDDPASKVCVGLQITARFKTLPLAIEAQAGGQGTQKNVNKVWLRVHESSSIFAGPTYAKVRQVKQRTTEPYGSPPGLISDEKSVVLSPEWNSSGEVCVEQVDPLPITVLSMVLEVASGD